MSRSADEIRPLPARNPIARALQKRLFTSKPITHLYAAAREARRHGGLSTALLDELDIALDPPADTRERIPARGPLVVVSNHPFGMLDGLVMMELLGSVREDFRVMANGMLGVIPEIADRCILVDPYLSPGSRARNLAAVRSAVDWVCAGKALVVFPAGDVARFRLSAMSVLEPTWSDHAARIARRAGAPVLPVRFHGGNSPLFHGLGVIHPRLASLTLPRELLNKRGMRVRVEIGTLVGPERLGSFSSASEATAYLRWRTELLPDREDTAARPAVAGLAPIATPVPSKELEREVAALPAASLLLVLGGLEVRLAVAARCPALLREIGRLREISFRGAGEGTGREIDLDEYDQDYLHLFLWNPERKEVAGAYRMGASDRLLGAGGARRLYTATLVRYDPRFLEQLGPALELGRSFVRPEYQRSATALMLLWKGIGAFVARNTRYRHLFGPVSISASYRPESRRLMCAFLERYHLAADGPRRVRPRHPYRVDPATLAGLGQPRGPGTIEELSALVAELEPDGKGVPVLLRQYLKLGGRLLSLGLDPDFGNVVDGMILVDLSKTERRTLARYMGPGGAERFLSHHEHAGRRTANEPASRTIRRNPALLEGQA